MPNDSAGTCVETSHLRRWLRAWFAAVLMGWALLASRPANAAPPNFLLIISDDQAWTDYGFMGHPTVRTPRLDRLASESLCFTRGYVPSSLCCPSLASIVTGRYPHQHGVVCNDPPRPKGMPAGQFYRSTAFREGRDRLATLLERWPTLPGALRSRGYRSFQSGKWWLESYARGGFTHGMTAGDPGTGGRHGDVGLEIGRKTLAPIREFVDEAVRDGHPWMVWYAPMMPHDPHTPPERFLSRYRDRAPSLAVAKYWGMVEWFDETCGELLDDLDRRGVSTNTVVVYVTDNGWITDPATGRYAPRSKQSPYDGGLRTPILVRWPGHIAPRREETPVSSVDIFPTLMRLAGIEPAADLPGVDLLDRRAVRRRGAVFGECFTHDAVDLERPAAGLRWRWVVEGNWKLIAPAPWNEPTGRPELYRLDRDPLELDDRSAAEPGRVRRLQRRLDDWWPGG
jgi:uncharacterized sulfatase